jgi:hypothetical protein
VAARPGISLQELLAAVDGAPTRDDAYLLIALGELYVDLYNSPLAQPATVSVLSNRQAATHDHQNVDREHGMLLILWEVVRVDCS